MQPSSELRFAAISKFVIIYNQVRGELDQHILLWGKLISYVPPLFENKCRGTTLIFEWRGYNLLFDSKWNLFLQHKLFMV